jgi:glycosyltransferase involved in cell wall biosynthesis
MKINVLIPAYQDGAGIQSLLTSLRDQTLSGDVTLETITVVFDASPDATKNAVGDWIKSNPSFQVLIRENKIRQGKALTLQDTLVEMIMSRRLNEIVVVCDEDITLLPGSLQSLVEPLCDPNLGVTWGITLPAKLQRGRWASCFQMAYANNLVRNHSLNSPRASGAFFAYRVSSLEHFSWKPDEVDDTQLERFIRSHNIPCTTSLGATVHAIPAGNYRDFYLRTYRRFHSRIPSDANSRSRSKEQPRVSKMAAIVVVASHAKPLASTAFRHPNWAAAYLLALIAAWRHHRKDPLIPGAIWETALSTKSSDTK